MLCGDASRLFFDHFSKHLSNVLGRTELCREVRNPRPQKPQIIRNENHHLALFERDFLENDREVLTCTQLGCRRGPFLSSQICPFRKHADWTHSSGMTQFMRPPHRSLLCQQEMAYDGIKDTASLFRVLRLARIHVFSSSTTLAAPVCCLSFAFWTFLRKSHDMAIGKECDKMPKQTLPRWAGVRKKVCRHSWGWSHYSVRRFSHHCRIFSHSSPLRNKFPQK